MMGKPPQEKKNAKEHGCPFFYFFIFFLRESHCLDAYQPYMVIIFAPRLKKFQVPMFQKICKKKKNTSSMVIVIWPSGLDFILFLSFDSI